MLKNLTIVKPLWAVACVNIDNVFTIKFHYWPIHSIFQTNKVKRNQLKALINALLSTCKTETTNACVRDLLCVIELNISF